MEEKILFVDDDTNVLAAFKRQLHSHFHIETANGGQEGLALITGDDPFAVIVSDMRMPQMDGIEFLAKAKELSPDSVRMMLTGYADLDTAIEAVNEGNIFRFLTKPCSQEILMNALRMGIKQFQLVTAERTLLEKTLSGSLKTLMDILSMVNPEAFSRASRIRRYVRYIAYQIDPLNTWQYELAGALCQIGFVTLPPDILKRISSREPLSNRERNMFESCPQVSAQLLAAIPRMDKIAAMIAGHQKPFQSYSRAPESPDQKEIFLGSQMLKIALDYDQFLVQGSSPQEAFTMIRANPNEYNPELVEKLGGLVPDEESKCPEKLKVRVSELETGWIIAEDIYAHNGLMLVKQGQEITLPVLTRLQSFSHGIGVQEPIEVFLP